MSFSEDEIERFRRRLEQSGQFPPETPYFVGVTGSKAWTSAIVVDFALSRTGDPVVLVFHQGFVYEFSPTKELSHTTTEIKINESLRHRSRRWLGEKLKNKHWSMSGVDEVAKIVSIKWDFTSCDIVKNLKYLAELGSKLGIKRVVVVTESGVNYNNIPAVVGNGVRVKLVASHNAKNERDYAFAILRKYLSIRVIRLQERSDLLARFRSVLASHGAEGLVPKEAHHSISALASFVTVLRMDEAGQLYFPEDLS